jgi:P27 family predicted phage terminase small subunit
MTTPKWIREPDGLSGQALSLWKSLAPSARKFGYLTAENAELFRAMCRAIALCDLAWAAIEADGVTIQGATGVKRAHPAIKILNDAQREADRLRREIVLGS